MRSADEPNLSTGNKSNEGGDNNGIIDIPPDAQLNKPDATATTDSERQLLGTTATPPTATTPPPMEPNLANVHVQLSPSSRNSNDSDDFYCVPDYQPPFTIYDRFTPTNEWNKDVEVSSLNIFTVDGKRRKREVKDNFEWLLPPQSRPAEISQALEAYSSNYLFQNGFHIADKLTSSSSYVIPQSVYSQHLYCHNHQIVANHPFCNVAQSLNWLVKPVANLLDRMHSSAQRPNTRSSYHDACLGQDLFLYSTYTAASDFVCSSDDVELVDIVEMDDILKKNPDIRNGPLKLFFDEPTFECSNSLIASLPFAFVKGLRLGKEVHFPKDWKLAVKNDAQQAGSKNIISMQLWRHRKIFCDNNKTSVDRIYRVEYNDSTIGKKSTKVAFVKEKVATFYIKSEPWILEDVHSLSCVRDYRMIVFGEGAKSSRAPTVNTGNDPIANFWHSTENHSKMCTEGAVANMLYHMNLKDDAIKFRHMAILPPCQLLEEMGVAKFPKRIWDTKRQCLDPIEKCMWIHEKKFNCRRFGYLNTVRCNTPAKLVEYLHQIQLPVILSVVGKNSLFNHVVVVWRDYVIDFEEQAKYLLSISNVANICGPKNQFLKVSRGHVMLPSRNMKSAVGDHSDWGEKHLKENLGRLFTKNVG